MRISRPASVVALALLGGLSLFSPTIIGVAAQEIAQESSVPRLVQFSGRVADPAGRPLAGLVDLSFALYASQDAAEPLWSETQRLQLGEAGQYAVMLGAASPNGIPRTVFASGEARWLGVKAPDGTEQPRLLLLSVPYALKAADAETLGGKPASAYVLASSTSTRGGDGGAGAQVREGDGIAAAAQGEPNITGVGTANFIPRWQSTDEIANSVIFQSTAGNIGIGTTSPSSKLTISSPTFDTVVRAESTYTAGNASVAIRGVTNGTNSAAIVAESNASTGFSAAVVGNANAGMGVSGESLGVSGYGVRGRTLGVGGVGVYGQGDNTTVSTGVLGISEGTSGKGVDARANATTGLTYGVLATNVSSSGTALAGVAGASSGNTFGLQAIVNSPAGVGARLENNGGGNLLIGRVSNVDKFKVDGAGAVYATSYRDLAGNPIPAGDLTGIVAGEGLSGGGSSGDVTLALDTTFTDGRYSLLGHGHVVGEVAGAATLGGNNFVGNQNVNGDLTATGGITGGSSAQGARAVRGDASGLSGVGVEGNATGEAGEGVRGIATGFDGLGVQGLATHSTGPATGVAGSSSSSEGIGVLGTGRTGVRGDSTHPGGVAGLFTTAGTDLLRGEVSDTTKFRVDGTGAVYASEYRDLAGNPIPSGTGDITSVAAGAGLAGGGGVGDVSLALDTAFTDGRYSLLGHGHTVSQVSGAATLGANSFNGNQSVTGDVIASGKVEAASNATFLHAIRGAASGTFGVGVKGEASGGSGSGVRGEATGSATTGVFGTFNGTNGSGVRGQSTATTGVGVGVRGSSGADFGTGLYGEATSTVGQGIGTRGQTSSPNGMGVMGYANATTGMPIGVRAVVESTGIAGTFENVTGSGDLIVGRTGPISGVYTNRFRVDTSGNVYAGSYRDLAGNPIPSGNGDITSVSAGSGLTGGGPTGDIALALNTGFTDGRYSLLGHGHVVSEVAGAASLAANTFSATQTINTGNLDLDASTATAGNITKNGQLFFHNYGSESTFVGLNAGNVTMSPGSSGNTGLGYRVLVANTTGFANTSIGREAMAGNLGGDNNTAVGVRALFDNTSGSYNTAIGPSTLHRTTSGEFNTAIGGQALFQNTTGQGNTAIGVNALEAATGSFNVGIGHWAGSANFIASSGSNNIYLGANVVGVAGESNTMYLGKVGTQTKTLIAGVRGTTTPNNDAVPVVIDSSGQLGTISSSRRFKDDIRDMDDASRRVLQLRPVTFRYSQPFADGSTPIQFGLVAEEVAQVFPELAVRNADGGVDTVHYERLSVLLLNEMQRQQRELDRQQERIEALERRMSALLQQQPIQ